MFVGLLVFVFCYMWSFVRYVGVYYTLGLLDCARYDEDFVISRFFPIHFTVTLAGLKSIVRHTEGFVIERFVKSQAAQAHVSRKSQR